MSAPRPHGGGGNAMAFVVIAVLINAIGFGIIIPVLPSLIVELTGQTLAEAAIHGGWLTFTYAVMQFVFMPIMGALSDAYGRRRVMLFSLAGLGLDYFLMALAPTIAFLYLGRLIAGGLGATLATANAYIADISPPDRRAQDFGLIGAAFGIGFILGPAIGGVLGDPNGVLGAYAGPRIPFYAAGVLSLVNVVYGIVYLPETLPPEKRRAFSWARANPFGAVISLARVTGVKGLLLVLLILQLAHTAYPSAYTFVMLEKLPWSEGDVGLSLAAFGLASAIVQGGLLRLIIPAIGQVRAALFGILSAIIAYAMMGVGTVGWVIYAAGPFAALAGLYGPSLTNMMSERVDASEQGELQGAIGAVQGLALIIGPLVMTRAFNLFASDGTALDLPYLPGAPFLLASGLATIGLVVLIGLVRPSPAGNLTSDAGDSTPASG